MKKILKWLAISGAVVVPTLGFTQEVHSLALGNWDLVAPAIYDLTNIPQAANGTIVYDSKTNTFYAKGPLGSGDWRGFATGVGYQGTLPLTQCTTARTVDWSQASSFTVTLTSSNTCGFTLSKMTIGQTITIWITNDSASGGTGSAGWATDNSSPVYWQGGTAPTITQGASKLDVCTFTYNGAAVAGSCIQDMH